MLDGYHRSFNNFGLQQIKAVPWIPDSALAVGTAETLQSVPIVLRYDGNPDYHNALYEKVTSSKDASPKWEDDQIALSAFPNSGWMGNPYSPWGGY